MLEKAQSPSARENTELPSREAALAAVAEATRILIGQVKTTASHWGCPCLGGAKTACHVTRQSSHMVAWRRSNSHIVELSPQVLTAAEVPHPG